MDTPRKHFDEMLISVNEVRAPYSAYGTWFSAQDPARLTKKSKEAEAFFRRTGITFNVYGQAAAQERLIPFDLNEEIRKSIVKTNRILIVDEDVPGGASSYILQQLIEKQNIFSLLDCSPKLLSAKAHRPAYGGDGDYFSKPSVDDVFESIYSIMNESNPNKHPL